MKTIFRITLLSFVFLGSTIGFSQTSSVSESLSVIVFPAEDQDEETQEFDEFKCYKWAIKNSGYDPMASNEMPDGTKLAADGSAVKGAVKGALFGAIIGAISGDTGKGAKIGAGVGGLGGAIEKGKRDAALKKAIAEAKRKNAEGLLKFRKAYSVCMEAKGYKVTF